jgi:hypothetical protein
MIKKKLLPILAFALVLAVPAAVSVHAQNADHKDPCKNGKADCKKDGGPVTDPGAPVDPTPEPSSAILIATGLLTLGGMAILYKRKRSANNQHLTS